MEIGKSTLRLLGHLSGITFGTETGKILQIRPGRGFNPKTLMEVRHRSWYILDQLEQEKGIRISR